MFTFNSIHLTSVILWISFSNGVDARDEQVREDLFQPLLHNRVG